MFTKTFWRRLGFAIEACLFVTIGPARGADLLAPTLYVAVHNDADVSPAMVVDAESAAGRIFSAAGLELEWINCGDSNEPASVAQHCTEVTYPTHLQLRILFRPRNLTASTLGISYLDEKGSGCYSEIFATQADDLALDSWFRAVLLGHVMAHEVGHLLLGTNSHSPLGLMRAHWEAVDLERAAKGQLLFTAQESERMKRRAQTASAKRETASAD